MKRIFLTGATGVMGMSTMKEILRRRYKGADVVLTVLARNSKKNRKLLRPFIKIGVEVIWGDLLDADAVARGVTQADIVLHVGGMVSPAADWYPEKTYRVNTTSMAHIIEAVKKREAEGHNVKVVYIGSVSQYGHRSYPVGWGRCGDPINVATFDKYALSKCVAEKMLSESGIKEWVSLRQTGIIYPAILKKGSDPISFHVPMATGIEWVTAEASGRLLAAICFDTVPTGFWKNYYNIGGGDSYRLSNYEFVSKTLSAVGCPPPEKVFDLNWFATRNFHGMYYLDSDYPEELFHYRGEMDFDTYLSKLKSQLPVYFRLAPLAPAVIIKSVMRQVALKKKLGTLWWVENDITPRIDAAWGSMEEYNKIPEDWRGFQLPPLQQKSAPLNHGYDETKEFETLTLSDLKRAAEYRGGKCHAEGKDGDIIEPDKGIEWECSEGHRFILTPRTVLKGGHWCGQCLEEINEDPHTLKRLARKNRFLAQVVR